MSILPPGALPAHHICYYTRYHTTQSVYEIWASRLELHKETLLASEMQISQCASATDICYTNRVLVFMGAAICLIIINNPGNNQS